MGRQFAMPKFFYFGKAEIVLSSRCPASTRGAYRDRHGRWKRDAVDAVVSRDERTEADGEGVWSWLPDAGAKVAGLSRE